MLLQIIALIELQKEQEKRVQLYMKDLIKEKRGKGYALEWMFNKIFKMTNGYNAVVVFDADNLVHKNFLNEMNKKND